ncbi:MAG TPA: VanZ family protein [Chitinophagaceae bacterium]|nr:VanZ family protein [Chitinophagaceae bacterium]
MKKLFSLIYIPLAWTIFIQVLLCVPGSALPSAESFDLPNLDKIIHVIFFGTLVVLWCFYLSRKVSNRRSLAILFFFVFLAASINGIAIEYIQLYFVPFRTFDQADITADILSAAIGYGICNVKLLT